ILERIRRTAQDLAARGQTGKSDVTTLDLALNNNRAAVTAHQADQIAALAHIRAILDLPPGTPIVLLPLPAPTVYNVTLDELLDAIPAGNATAQLLHLDAQLRSAELCTLERGLRPICRDVRAMRIQEAESLLAAANAHHAEHVAQTSARVQVEFHTLMR